MENGGGSQFFDPSIREGYLVMKKNDRKRGRVTKI